MGKDYLDLLPINGKDFGRWRAYVENYPDGPTIDNRPLRYVVRFEGDPERRLIVYVYNEMWVIRGSEPYYINQYDACIFRAVRSWVELEQGDAERLFEVKECALVPVADKYPDTVYQPATNRQDIELSSDLLNDKTHRDTPPAHTQLNKAGDPYRIVGGVLSGKYKLIEYSGGGGMGAVYRAVDENSDTVAVKILKPDIVARNPEYIQLFGKEVKAAQQLSHPNIVKVLDSGIDDGIAYMVMEWLEGKHLEDVITEELLPLDRIIRIFDQVCDAVDCAHRNNVIHLDLKPANILLIKSEHLGDHVKVIDFGLARVITKESGTTVTHFRGTHQYCAPEQFGGRVSKRSDIYSLGATLYYLISGVIPFGTSYINAKAHQHLELPEIPSPTKHRNFPPGIDLVIRKSLNKNPDLRQQTTRELFEEFHQAALASENNLEAGVTPNNSEATQEKAEESIKRYSELREGFQEITLGPPVAFIKSDTPNRIKPVLPFRRLPVFLIIVGAAAFLVTITEKLLFSHLPESLERPSLEVRNLVVYPILLASPLSIVRPKRLIPAILFLSLVFTLTYFSAIFISNSFWTLPLFRSSRIIEVAVLAIIFAYKPRSPYRMLTPILGGIFAEILIQLLIDIDNNSLALRNFTTLGTWFFSGGLWVIFYWLGIIVGDYLGVLIWNIQVKSHKPS